MKTITAAEVAKKLMKTICQHGIMEQILTYQGTNFQAELMKELYELLDVHQTRTSPFRPQTDGLSERFNQTLKKMITAYVDEIGDDWDEKLDILAFAYNTATHCTTKCTPFEAMATNVTIDLALQQLCRESKENFQNSLCSDRN